MVLCHRNYQRVKSCWQERRSIMKQWISCRRDSVEALTEKLLRAVEALSGLEGILILTDIAGGSPFNVSLKLKLTRTEAIEVIGGTNLPVLLEAYLSRAMYEGAGTPSGQHAAEKDESPGGCGREM